MTQKIIQIGNSTGIIIPKSILNQLGLKAGSDVRVEMDMDTKSLIIRHTKAASNSTSINAHFLKILDKVNAEYSKALGELAQK